MNRRNAWCKDPDCGCDSTKLGHDLFLLERSDPDVAAARARLDEAVDRVLHPEDHVIAANLRVNSEGP